MRKPVFRSPAWARSGVLLLLACASHSFAQAPITNGLVHRWTGDGNAKDVAAHDDGKVSGGLRYENSDTGQAFAFNGKDAQINFGASAGNFGSGDFTIAYWMKTRSTSLTEAFLEKRDACNSGHFFGIRLGSPIPANGLPVRIGQPGLEIDEGPANTHVSFMASGPFNDGRWHHFAWMRQSTSAGSITYLLYVDGLLDSTMAVPGAADTSNHSPLVMGVSVCQCCDGTTPFSGAAKDLQLFSHALSDDEVSSMYKAGVSPH
ncbi:MAG TPA: LamG domain-containing protein [Candidatus Acidoferrum sp.]|nr:LamG domain-containing protein [Candidatus Acidoferrum sp.]